MEVVGTIRRLAVGLDRDHQILVGNPDVERPIAEAFALVEPLRTKRPEDLVSGFAANEAKTYCTLIWRRSGPMRFKAFAASL